MRGVARGDGCGLVQGSHEEGISYVQLRATFEEYEKVGVARVWYESGNIFW